MKIGRATTAVVILVLAATVMLAFLYAVPAGRRARREALRAVRLARNATGVYPLPVLTIRMWQDTQPGVLLIEVYESGRVVLSRPGEHRERQLPRQLSARIIESGKVAMGDFSLGCETEAGGLNAALYVLIDGAWKGSICHDASDWPRGFETQQLFAEIQGHIPDAFDGFLPHRSSGRPDTAEPCRS